MGFLFGSSTWARTRDLRINRKPGSSKTLINQRLTGVFIKRVIFRVITPKVTLCNFPAKTPKFTLSAVILHLKSYTVGLGLELNFSKVRLHTRTADMRVLELGTPKPCIDLGLMKLHIAYYFMPFMMVF